MDSSLKKKPTRSQSQQNLHVFYQAQISILEKIAEGTPLTEILESIVHLVEEYSSGLCSILLLDPESHRITHGAAPNLPPEFLRAIDGIQIGSSAGSCGTAAFIGKRVIVENIESHPYWDDYRKYALPYELRACWSSPIFSSDHQVLGTFAVYYNEPRRPTESEMEWVDSATHLAAIALMKSHAEHALRRSEARYRQLMQTTHEGAIILDLEGKVTFANPRVLQMLGYSFDELVGLQAFKLVQDCEVERVSAMLERRRQGVTEQAEVMMKTKAGEILYVIICCSPIFGEDGSIEAMLGMLTDITERKKAELALQKRELQLRTMFDGASIAMILVDQDFVPLKSNQAAEKLLNFSNEELLQKNLIGLVHSADLSAFVEKKSQMDSGLMTAYKIESRLLKKCQEYAWTRMTICQTGAQVSNKQNSIVIIEDLEQSKELEKQFRAAEQLRALTFDAVADVLFYMKLESGERFRFLSANKTFFQSTGLRSEQVIGRFVEEVIPEPSLTLILQKYRQAINERTSIKWEETTEYPSGRKFGEVVVTPIFDDDGGCLGLVGTVHDITERKFSEERIRAQAAILDHAHDAILMQDLNNTILYWNQGATRLYGYDSDEVLGKKVTDLLYKDTKNYFEAQNEVIRRGDWAGEIEQSNKAGDSIVIEGSWTLLRDAEGAPSAVLAINTDITEKKKLRDQVALVQRMESLGTFAGGIAHDFNNLLTAIIGNISLAKKYLPRESRAEEKLEIATAACNRATELVRRILTFSRQPEQERVELNLSNLAEETCQLLRSVSPAMIEIQTSFNAQIPVIFVDASQMHQVIMNLATNSIQAMGDHGILSISVDKVTLKAAMMSATGPLEAGDYIRLIVKDTGPGISNETLERIFEPFFTTKDPGHGTGLGLSVVHSIVRDHAGGILVASQLGKGTEFDIYLPVTQAPEFRPRLPLRETIPYGQGERILFVDDESSISILSQQILETSGYEVTACLDPREALAIFTKSPKNFDALVTDFAMPSLSGLELADAALRIQPKLPVILISGYLRLEDEKKARALGVKEILGKPSSVNEMLFALGRIFQKEKNL